MRNEKIKALRKPGNIQTACSDQANQLCPNKHQGKLQKKRESAHSAHKAALHFRLNWSIYPHWNVFTNTILLYSNGVFIGRYISLI